EVGVGVRLGIQHLGPLAERDRLTRQALSFGVLPAASAHFCHYLPPEHLRDRVVACAKRRRAACPTVGLLESAELVIRLGELSRDGGQDRLLFELAEKAA